MRVKESEFKIDPNGSNFSRMPWYGVPNVAFNEIAERSIARAQQAAKVFQQPS